MYIEIDKKPLLSVIKITAKIELSDSEEFSSVVSNVLESGETKIVFNLLDLTFINSAGLRVIITTKNKVKAIDGKFSLCLKNESIRNIIDIAGLNDFLGIFDNLQDAENFVTA